MTARGGSLLFLALGLVAACGQSPPPTTGVEGGADGTGSCLVDCQACAPDSQEACYDGPVGTAGVGACKEGLRTCPPDGSAWGPCEREVTPIGEEVCANGVDEDCNGAVDDVLEVSDLDGDGFTRCDGDCCETTAQCPFPERVNPAAVEVPTSAGDATPLDENCNGAVDELPLNCDAHLPLDDADPFHAAQALDLCEMVTAQGRLPGVISAQWVRADGSPSAASLQVGLMAGFGANVSVQAGERLLVLSTGHARLPDQPDACGTDSCRVASGPGIPPVGFPQGTPGCASSDSIEDDVALELTLRAPANALGFAFRFKFYSFEYPDFLCDEFNDQFIALVSPAPKQSVAGNVAFDSRQNPVTVNANFFDVCAGCSLGTAELLGTGFDTWHAAGATSWQRGTASVTPGEVIKIRFAIWDGGDGDYDSTVLIDGFEWLASSTTVGPAN